MKLRYKIRSIWEEVKLRLRVFWAASKPWVGDITPTGRMYAKVKRRDGSEEDLGLLSTKVVTDDGVGFIVDAFQNTVELETMKYHGSGTGAVAEAASDSTLGTEVESRGTGTTAEGASANIYQTVGTVNYTGTHAITEHGVFSAASSGVLLDRSVFSAINVDSGDSIQFTYELTFPAGS